jgi:outer membrane receptor for ferrienterochelin and colicins
VFNSQREWTRDERAYVDLKFERFLTDELRLSARTYYDATNYFGQYPTNHAEPQDPMDIVDNRDATYGRWIGTELQLTQKLADKHTFVLGAEFRNNLRQEQVNYDDLTPREYLINDTRSGKVLGLFGQAEVSLRRDLLLNVGLRLDDYVGGFGSTWHPRVGLIYNPTPQQSFKLLYGDAFRAPNAYEMGYLVGGSSLRPEGIKTYEAISETYLAPHYKITESIYHYRVRDLIDIEGADSAFPNARNVGRAEATGGEIEIEAKYENGVLLRGSYALQRSRDDITMQELSNSPRHLAKVNFFLPLGFGANAGIEAQYTGSAETINGGRAPDFWLTNITLLEGKFAKNMQVSATVYNVFDSKYGYPGSSDHLQTLIPQDGRSFRVKLQLKF